MNKTHITPKTIMIANNNSKVEGRRDQNTRNTSKNTMMISILIISIKRKLDNPIKLKLRMLTGPDPLSEAMEDLLMRKIKSPNTEQNMQAKITEIWRAMIMNMLKMLMKRRGLKLNKLIMMKMLIIIKSSILNKVIDIKRLAKDTKSDSPKTR